MTTGSWLLLILMWVISGLGAYIHAHWNYCWSKRASLLFALGGPITLVGGIFEAWLPVLAAASIAGKLFGAYALWQLVTPLLQGESNGITPGVWLKGFAAWYFLFCTVVLVVSLWMYHTGRWSNLDRTFYWSAEDSQLANTIKSYMFAPEMLIFGVTLRWRSKHLHEKRQEYA